MWPMKSYPITVEIIEDRMGDKHSIFFTKARRKFLQPANISVYEVKGVKRDLPAPSYSHIEHTQKGQLLRLYSPNPDDYYFVTFSKKTGKMKILETVPMTVDDIINEIKKGTPRKKIPNEKVTEIEKEITTLEMTPSIDEESKNWLNWRIERAHEKWKTLSLFEKYGVLIMFIILVAMNIIGIKMQTDTWTHSVDAATATANSAAEAAKSLKDMSANIYAAAHELSNTNSGTNVNEQPTQPPPV